MIEAVSSGGVVIFRGKILVLYKHLHNKYEGWDALNNTSNFFHAFILLIVTV